MKLHPCLTAVALMLALAGCYPPLTAEWTESETPKVLTLDKAGAQIGVRFAAGSDALWPADAARLRHLALTGMIAPTDRVTVAVDGVPPLAEARFHRIAGELAAYRIVALQAYPGNVPPNRGIIDTGRYLVTLPPCPNWSKPSVFDYNNTLPSNYGCATVSNLGRMVWRPADLVEGVPHETWYSAEPNINLSSPVINAGGAPFRLPPSTPVYYAPSAAVDTAIRVPGAQPSAGAAPGGTSPVSGATPPTPTGATPGGP